MPSDAVAHRRRQPATSEPLDTHRAVETPEGVDFALPVAGPASRSVAWALDCVIRGLAYSLLSVGFAFAGDAGMGFFFLSVFVGEWFYPVVFEVFANGATPGKMLLRLAVLHQDGSPVGWTASILRNFLRFADFLPVAYGFGLVSMLVTRDFQRLGDLAAGTVVVHRDEVRYGSRVPPAEPLAPPLPLDVDEQRAVIEFAERVSGWSEPRARELAGLAAPLTGETGGWAVARLIGIANWLVGRRAGGGEPA